MNGGSWFQRLVTALKKGDLFFVHNGSPALKEVRLGDQH